MRREVLVALIAALSVAFGCSWKRCAYERGDRDGWQQPEQVIETLGVAPGMKIADLGSGTGYFTVKLAPAVGPEGRVYAVDVDADVHEELRERLASEGIENVEIVLGELDDPLLPDGEIDLVLTVNTFHHIQDRPAFFERVKADLAPGGRVAIIDYDGTRGWLVKLIGHWVEKGVILGDMQDAGYTLVEDVDWLDRQSFLVFQPK